MQRQGAKLQNAGFGNRGRAAIPVRTHSARRAPLVVPASQLSELDRNDAVLLGDFEADGNGQRLGHQAGPGRGSAEPYSVVWAFCVAVAYAMFCFIIAAALIGGIVGHGTWLRVQSIIMAPFLAVAVIPMAGIACGIISTFLRVLPFRTGARAVLAGGLVGSLGVIAPMTAGEPFRVTGLAFVAAGFAGGFTYWRLRGFPEAGPKLEAWARKLYAKSPVLARWMFKFRSALG